MVHVQHGGLTTLEQHRLAGVQRPVQHQARIGHVRLQAFAELKQLVGGAVHVDGAAVVQLDQHLVLLVQAGLHLVMQVLGVEQVVHADADAVDLVRVGRADAAACGADLALAQETFGHLVDHAMVRGDDLGRLAHQQAGAVQAAGFQAVDLLEEHLRIHHHAVADHRRDVRVDDATGQQVQRVRLIADRVARVVAAVEAGDVIDLGADQIGHLALAFVAPLSADQHDSRHSAPPYAPAIPSGAAPSCTLACVVRLPNIGALGMSGTP